MCHSKCVFAFDWCTPHDSLHRRLYLNLLQMSGSTTLCQFLSDAESHSLTWDLQYDSIYHGNVVEVPFFFLNAGSEASGCARALNTVNNKCRRGRGL